MPFFSTTCMKQDTFFPFLFPAKCLHFQRRVFRTFFFRNLIKDDHGFHEDVLSSEALHMRA
jgi:hypothetical protein